MNRPWSRLGAILLLLAACKGGDKSNANAGKAGSGPAGKAGTCETTAAKPADLVVGKTPQPIAPFAGLKLGMTAAEAKAVCPNMWDDEDDSKKTGTFSVGGNILGKFGEEYVQGRLEFFADKLVAVSLDLPSEIESALTAAWSAPVASAGPAVAHAWHDPATGVRAILGPADRNRRELMVSTYVPLQAFVELDPKTLPFKPQEILGKTPKELMAKFPAYVRPDSTSESTNAATEAMMKDLKKDVEAMGVDTTRKQDQVEVRLPATPFGSGLETQAIFHQNDDGTVRDYGLWFRTAGIGMSEAAWPGEITEVVALFDKLWGPAKKIKRTLGEELTWYDPTLGIRAAAELDPSKPNELSVDYVRYQPLATFFGAKGPVWGFEKPERPLLGATPEELVAAYGSAVKLDPDGGTATLEFLPTDYDDDVATTRILAFIRNGKVEQWNCSIGFEDYEPSKAEYEALLAAKFGPPKPAPHDHLIYSKKPTVDVEFSSITHEMDLEVSK